MGTYIYVIYSKILTVLQGEKNSQKTVKLFGIISYNVNSKLDSRSPSRNNYGVDPSQYPANTRATSNNLGPEDGSMRQYKTETQKKYPAYDNVSGGRATPYKPGSQIRNSGDLNFETEKRSNFQYYDEAQSSKVPPPPDNLHPMDGTMSQYKTEAQKRYKAYDNVTPRDPVKPTDNIELSQGQNTMVWHIAMAKK